MGLNGWVSVAYLAVFAWEPLLALISMRTTMAAFSWMYYPSAVCAVHDLLLYGVKLRC